MKSIIQIKSVLLLSIVLICTISNSFSLSLKRSRSKKSHSLNKRQWDLFKSLFNSPQDKVIQLLNGDDKYNCQKYKKPINDFISELKKEYPQALENRCFKCANDAYFRTSVDAYNQKSSPKTLEDFVNILGEKLQYKFLDNC